MIKRFTNLSLAVFFAAAVVAGSGAARAAMKPMPFSQADTNRDGVISIQEAENTNAMTRGQFDQADKDRSGDVSMKEYQEYFNGSQGGGRSPGSLARGSHGKGPHQAQGSSGKDDNGGSGSD